MQKQRDSLKRAISIKKTTMKIIVRCVKQREEYVQYLKGKLPIDTVFLYDKHNNAFLNFLDALCEAGNDSALHIEDDVLLTDGFTDKVIDIINSLENNVIQFFSMRGKDLTVGSRFENGRTFMMGQCFYLPKNVSKEIYNFKNEWIDYDKGNNPTGLDLMVARYLSVNKINYYIYVPNLVNHRICKSIINPKRSSKRQSLTFE